MERRTAVIIVAGGRGTRCGGTLPKQFRLLGNRPVLARTIDLFATTLRGAEIVVVLPAQYVDFWKDYSARFDVAAHTVVAGGAERFDSVRCGLQALRTAPELIAVQDAVRPLGTPEMIRRIVAAAAESGAAVPVVAPVDSFREVDDKRAATEHSADRDEKGLDTESRETSSRIVDRRRLRIVQTPQVFRADWLTEAYRAEYDPRFTDDASVVEAAGHAVRLVEGERTNLKLTEPDDFAVAEALLAAREEREEENRTESAAYGAKAETE
ncbi:MAG: 2-C-methyl-D-erythritol 4-phosphate cytidylyltransferase [Alistipes senegalensis]|nr:2-C-methyl-D-erythritol 4-phosphate cytidylyltransferase [Bacteroides cellulosilyticus]MCM1351741.1 2-C-methyl-D-erythritol 4-phosphate cytidylyltransferase [Alistipes senegalensis]